MSDADETGSPGRSPRVLRLAALIAVAVIAVGIASFSYLHPNFGQSTTSSIQIRQNPTAGRFVTMSFTEPTTGWVAVGDRDGNLWVFVTHDAGGHWTAQLKVSVRSDVTGGELQFFDSRSGIVYVPGTSHLYRTMDAGLHWMQLAVTGKLVASASFADANHGWLVAVDTSTGSLQSVLYRTTDGGGSWTNLGIPVAPGDSMQAVHFSTPTEGWLDVLSTGPYLYATVDGGESWRPLPIVAPATGWPGGPYVVFARMLPPSSVVATVMRFQRFTFFGTGPFSGSLLDKPDIPSAELPNVLLAYSAQPGQTFSASGARLGPPTDLALAPYAVQTALSVDGGRDWFAQDPTFGVAGQADALHWWWTYGGLLFKSSDGGGTWTRVQKSDLSVSFAARTLQVIDGQNAWMSGFIQGGDALLETRNGGTTWVKVGLPKV